MLYSRFLLLISFMLCARAQSLCHIRLLGSPRTVAHQALLSMGFSRQEHWSGLPFPSPGNLPNPRIEAASPALAGRFFTTEPPGKPILCIVVCILEKAMAPHSSTLAWKNPRTEEPGRLQSTGSRRVGHD